MQSWKDILSPASIYIYILIVSALLIYAAAILYQFFPNMYTWRDLFINYEGGFLRRAFIGQLLFLADSVVPIQIYYLIFYSILFYAFLYFSYKKLMKVFDPIVVAFFFISPVIFLLPITDRGVFGHKDLFIEIIILCVAQICINYLIKEKSSLYRSTLLIFSLFIIGILIYEITILYLPLSAILLGVAYARQKKIFQWLLMTGVLFSVTPILFVFMFQGTVEMRDAICAAWTQRYPDLICDAGALKYIGHSFSDHAVGAFSRNVDMSWLTTGSAILGFVLSAIPLIFFWIAYRPYEAIRNFLSTSLVLRLAFWPAVFSPFIHAIIAEDFGRTISIAFLSYIFFLYAVFSLQPQPAAPWLHKLKEAFSTSPRVRYAIYLFAIAYGLCWRMLHHAPSGKSYVIPGVLLHLQ